QVVGVSDPDDIPAVTLAAAGGVVATRQGGVALDGDVVVVVDPAEVGEPQVSRQRRRFVRDALHHAAVAAQGVDVKSIKSSNAGRLWRAAIRRPASAIPTLVAIPWPSGPVVVSTPLVQRYSGCPGQRLSSCRNRRIASSGTDGSPRASYSLLTAFTPVRC